MGWRWDQKTPKSPFSSKALGTSPSILSQGSACGSEAFDASLKKSDLDIYPSSHPDDPVAGMEALWEQQSTVSLLGQIVEDAGLDAVKTKETNKRKLFSSSSGVSSGRP